MKRLFVLHAHDNSYKSTITAIAGWMMSSDFNKTDLFDAINVNTLISKIEVLKSTSLKQVFHFSEKPKDIFRQISNITEMSSNKNADRLQKELVRGQFVDWAEQQKVTFGSNVWSIPVIKAINKKIKSHDTFWIGDLRFETELAEIQKTINPKFDVKFISVNVIGHKQAVNYYEKQTLPINSFHFQITIDESIDYNNSIQQIYYQLKEILK